MTPEQSQSIITQYQQWLANAQLELAVAKARIAELEAMKPADA